MKKYVNIRKIYVRNNIMKDLYDSLKVDKAVGIAYLKGFGQFCFNGILLRRIYCIPRLCSILAIRFWPMLWSILRVSGSFWGGYKVHGFGQNKMITRLNVLTGETVFFTDKTDEELVVLIEIW